MNGLTRCAASLGCVLLLGLAPLTVPAAAPSRGGVVITIYFGEQPKCTGWGFCRITIGWQSDSEAPQGGQSDKAKPPRKGRASAELRANKLYVDLQTALPRREEVVPINAKISLDRAASRAFGYGSVTILPGQYKIDYSKNKLGSVVLSVEAQK